ncbi:hypothetical protein ACQ86D_01395 [Streptomyces galilaeus]
MSLRQCNRTTATQAVRTSRRTSWTGTRSGKSGRNPRVFNRPSWTVEHYAGRVFRQRRDPSRRPMMIGSVKTNAGHTEAASGMADLFKSLLVPKDSRIPARLHACTPRNSTRRSPSPSPSRGSSGSRWTCLPPVGR